jgi:hypothetical protein
MHARGGTLVCMKCGQTKNVPVGVRPDLDAKWHECDPQNVHSPERHSSNEIFRTLTHLVGKPIKIGGIDAEQSAYNDIKRRSTEK